VADPTEDRGAPLEPFTDTSLYTLGAYFADRHPDLVDDVIEQAADIEEAGLQRYADAEGIELETAFQTLVTGLAVTPWTGPCSRRSTIHRARQRRYPGGPPATAL